jgi:hypothetical protein
VASETREPAEAYACALRFDTDRDAFARGFEAGRLWALLRERPHEEVEELTHGSNAEMVLRMAEALGRAVRSEDLDETWMIVHFLPRSSRLRVELDDAPDDFPPGASPVPPTD